MKIVDLKKDMDARFDALGKDVDARFDAQRKDMDARFDAQGKDFDRKLATEHSTTRRHMDVLFEQFRAENRLGLEKIAALEQQFISFQATNGFEHATFVEMLQNHERRIKALEPGGESST